VPVNEATLLTGETAMDTDLDDQLAAAAPPVAERTTAMLDALTDLVDATDTATRPRRHRRRASVGIAALALTAVAGVGSAAAAGLVGRHWWDEPDVVTHHSTTASGEPCTVTYGSRELRDPAHPVSARDRAAAMTATTEFLRQFDYSTVDGKSTEGALDEVYAQLTESLARQGLSTYAVSIGVLTDCETGAEQ
jgi:hypothetical protein